MVTGFTLRLYLSCNHTVQEKQLFCLQYFSATTNHRVMTKALLKENAVFQHCIKTIVFFYAKKIHWQILPHFYISPNSAVSKLWISDLHSVCSITIRVCWELLFRLLRTCIIIKLWNESLSKLSSKQSLQILHKRRDGNTKTKMVCRGFLAAK